jgi:hypothetical protein
VCLAKILSVLKSTTCTPSSAPSTAISAITGARSGSWMRHGRAVERHSHSESARRERGDSGRDRRYRGQVRLPSNYRAPRCGCCRRVGGRLSRAARPRCESWSGRRANDVSLRCLDGSMAKQKPNLCEFAAAIMADSGTGATKVVGRYIGYAGLPGTSLDRIPDHVRGHPPASCRFPTFETLLNTRPSLTPECESHASSNCLDHDGTGTVRSRLPLPIKSTMTSVPRAFAVARASIRRLQNAVAHNREVSQR